MRTYHIYLLHDLQLARAALWELAQLGGKHTQLAMRYIGLFAPINGKLEFEQIYRLLKDLRGIWHDYTTEDWQNACEKLLAEKITGSLKVPLQNHERLMELLETQADAHRLPSVKISDFGNRCASSFAGLPENQSESPMQAMVWRPNHNETVQPYSDEQRQRAHEQVVQMIRRVNQTRKVYP